jgi:hypothetical protein
MFLDENVDGFVPDPADRLPVSSISWKPAPNLEGLVSELPLKIVNL